MIARLGGESGRVGSTTSRSRSGSPHRYGTRTRRCRKRCDIKAVALRSDRRNYVVVGEPLGASIAEILNAHIACGGPVGRGFDRLAAGSRPPSSHAPRPETHPGNASSLTPLTGERAVTDPGVLHAVATPDHIQSRGSCKHPPARSLRAKGLPHESCHY